MSSIATQLRLNQLLPSSKTEIASRTSSAEHKYVVPNRKDFKLLTNSAHQIRLTMVAMTPVKPDDNYGQSKKVLLNSSAVVWKAQEKSKAADP